MGRHLTGGLGKFWGAQPVHFLFMCRPPGTYKTVCTGRFLFLSKIKKNINWRQPVHRRTRWHLYVFFKIFSRKLTFYPILKLVFHFAAVLHAMILYIFVRQQSYLAYIADLALYVKIQWLDMKCMHEHSWILWYLSIEDLDSIVISARRLCKLHAWHTHTHTHTLTHTNTLIILIC